MVTQTNDVTCLLNCEHIVFIEKEQDYYNVYLINGWEIRINEKENKKLVKNLGLVK